MKKLIIIGLIFIIGCNSNPQTNIKTEKELYSKYKIQVNKFLADQSTPKLAKDLYLGKVRPNDNEENLALIDSINSIGHARAFYFLVITKTMDHSDGSYSEPLGIAAKEFVENNTVEFLSYFKNNPDLLTDKDFGNWAQMIYGEIRISSEGSEQKAINDLKAKMISNCNGLTDDYKDKIVNFIGLMK